MATDHASYLLPPGTADIFFPTDFQMLDRMYSSVAKACGEEAGIQSGQPRTINHCLRSPFCCCCMGTADAHRNRYALKLLMGIWCHVQACRAVS